MAEQKAFSLSEIAKHKQKDSLWIVIHNNVYDVSKYMNEHPGGADALKEVAGADATSAFEDVGHSQDARETMHDFLIGACEENFDTSQEKKRKPVQPLIPPSQRAREKSVDATDAFHGIFTKVIEVGAAGSVCWAGYQVSDQLHLSKDFWHGALTALVASSSVTLILVLQVLKRIDVSKSMSVFPPLMKPSVRPVTHVKGVLNPTEYQQFPLVRKEMLSSNVCKFIFALPSPDSVLGLPIGQHIGIRGDVDGKSVSRSYTPVSNNKDLGELRLVIKIYDDGKLTGGYLSKLRVGDKVEFRGPKGAMRYRKGHFTHLGMVAGGTGITPMYQLIRAICEDKTDTTQVSLIYANRTEEDIILRSELQQFAERYPKNFKLWYTVDQPPEKGWKFSSGRVTLDMMKDRLHGPSETTQTLLCGPPGLVKGSSKSLVEWGFQEPRAVSKMNDQIFLF